MTKYLLLLIISAGLIFVNSGCTSNKTEDGSEVIENADAEKIEAEDLDVTENTQNTDPSFEESTVTTATSEPATPVGETSAPGTAPTLDDTSLNLDAPVSEVITKVETTAPEAPTSAPEQNEVKSEEMVPDIAALDQGKTPSPEAPAPESSTSAVAETPVSMVDNVPVDVTPSTATSSGTAASSGKVLKKIALTQPYQSKDGGWINTVYVARPKEKLADISFKIFGADKSKELKKINENHYLKSRSVKAGDKIYYSSPNRPNDSSKMMVYYEDMGAVPETYVTKKGDRLPKVAKELLGFNDAWKEIWTSNTVESKSKLKEGETLRYWKADSSSEGTPQTMAQNTPPKESMPTLTDKPPVEGMSPPLEAPPQQAALPPPPPDTQPLPSPPTDANSTMQTPGATEQIANQPGTTPESLPPPPAEMAPPPPPPPPPAVAEGEKSDKPKVDLDAEVAANGEGEDGAVGLDSNSMMAIGMVAVLVGALAFLIIKKKRQRSQQASENDINI